MAVKKKADRGALRTYKSYLFVEKDPIIDVVRTARSDAQMSYQEVEEASGVKVATLKAWETGDTKRPFFVTVSAVLRACGVRGIRYNSRGKPERL